MCGVGLGGGEVGNGRGICFLGWGWREGGKDEVEEEVEEEEDKMHRHERDLFIRLSPLHHAENDYLSY